MADTTQGFSETEMEKIAAAVDGIFFVAFATTLLSRRETARQITAIGDAFNGAIRAAMGK